MMYTMPHVVEQSPPRRVPARGLSVAIAIVSVVAVTALGIAGAAFTRPAPMQVEVGPPGPTAGTSTSAVPVDAAATEQTCGVWRKVARAMVEAGQPFAAATVEGKTWTWDDPDVQAGLSLAEAGVMAQADYMRRHISAGTAPDLVEKINQYVDLHVDIVALDGQRSDASAVNSLTRTVNDLQREIAATCKQ